MLASLNYFGECESKALAIINGNEEKEQSDSMLQGHLFEELVAGDGALYIAQHPEMVSTRGATAGQLKAEYQKVIKAAERFKQQKIFMDAIKNSEKQQILTGEIEGVPVKCCLDLIDLKTFSIYDIKCMKDFKEQWSSEEKRYIPWYYHWGYVLQLAVYREIARQNTKINFTTHLMAATKEDEPDISGLKISNDLLDLELDYFKSKIKHFDNIKKGIEQPHKCGVCDYCKKNKIITEFEEVK